MQKKLLIKVNPENNMVKNFTVYIDEVIQNASDEIIVTEGKHEIKLVFQQYNNLTNKNNKNLIIKSKISLLDNFYSDVSDKNKVNGLRLFVWNNYILFSHVKLKICIDSDVTLF